MSMAVGSGEGGYVADINVRPMVDVMLVLLIIFMVIAPMLQTGVSVTLPKSKYPDPDPNIIKDTSAVVSITPDDKIFFGRDPVTKDDLAKKIGNVLKDKLPADQVVYVKSDKMVKYGTVVNVVDAIREGGYERIGLVAETEKEPGGPN